LKRDATLGSPIQNAPPAALVDYMEVAGWIEQDLGADFIGRCDVAMPVRQITE